MTQLTLTRKCNLFQYLKSGRETVCSCNNTTILIFYFFFLYTASFRYFCCNNWLIISSFLLFYRELWFSKLGYPDADPPKPGKFTPRRQPGLHLNNMTRHASNSIRRPDFFLMFFSAEVIRNICDFTNSYAWVKVLETTSYGDRHGAWKEVTPDETQKN